MERSGQGHSSHTDENAVATRACSSKTRAVNVATESNPADMLTKALGRSKVEEFCAEIGRTEPHAKTLDKKPKKLKEVKFAIETMEANDGAVVNKFEGFKNFIDHARGCRIAMDAPLW